MVIANFEKKFTSTRAFGLFQYDYGQILRIQGLNLPKAVEIHFAYQPSGGEALRRIGTTKDGATDVVIPDSMLENNNINEDYKLFVFVYLTDETSGQTEYTIEMHVKSRPKPEAYSKPEDVEIFRDAIKAVNDSAARAEKAEQSVKESAIQVDLDTKQIAQDKEEIKVLVNSVSGISEQVEKVRQYSEKAQTASDNALMSEQKSEEVKNVVLQTKTLVEASEEKVSLTAQEVEQNKRIVEQEKNSVQQLSQQVLENKAYVDNKVQEFTDNAENSKSEINNLKDTALSQIETNKANAISQIQSEGVNQTSKVTSEGNKQVQAVQNKGNEILQSIQQDFASKIDAKLDKNLGIDNNGKILCVNAEGNINPVDVNSTLVIDKTLTRADFPADAKSVGDKITALENSLVSQVATIDEAKQYLQNEVI